MWRIIFILLWASLSLASCDNKRTCPLCHGEGEILVEGIMRECIVCKGEKKVDEDTYKNFFKALERMHSGGSMSEPAYGNGAQDMVDCPMCSGTGIFSFYGESHPCNECRQTGKVTPQRAAQLRQTLRQVDQMTGGGGYDDTSIQYGSSSGNGSGRGSYDSGSGNECRSCGGTGDCTYCNGVKVVPYDGEYGEEGGFMKCPVCKGSGKCGVCHGYGKIR